MFKTLHFVRAIAATAVLSTALLSGCKKTLDDTTVNNNVHGAIAGDPAISQEPIQTSVTQGVVTLQGNVSSTTARLVAAQDAAKVAGVREVVNNLNVAGATVTPTITTPPPTSTDVAPQRPVTRQERASIAANRPLPPPPAPARVTPAAPAEPVFHDVTVPAGRDIPVRITETLSSETAQSGDRFHGVVAAPINVGGELAIPAGSSVTGHVVAAKDATHFKGSSELSVVITSIDRHGSSIAVSAAPYTLEGKGRGVNTAEKIGGGAAIGAVLGGIFGGGKGAAIGTAAGAGGGTVLQGATRGQQVSIGSEQVVRFQLTSGITVRSEGPSSASEPGLHRR